MCKSSKGNLDKTWRHFFRRWYYTQIQCIDPNTRKTPHTSCTRAKVLHDARFSWRHWGPYLKENSGYFVREIKNDIIAHLIYIDHSVKVVTLAHERRYDMSVKESPRRYNQPTDKSVGLWWKCAILKHQHQTSLYSSASGVQTSCSPLGRCQPSY